MAALKTKSICLSVLVALLALVHLCSAAQLTVGESSGWTFGVNYTQWAASKTFQVGDTLLFPYAQGVHNVLEVSRADHDSCSTANVISTYANANAVVTLSKSGQHWFICGIPGHCTAGMKLAVNVLDSTSSTVSPAPAPAPASLSPAPSPRRGLSPRASPAPLSTSPVSAPTPAAEGPISGGVLPPTPSSDSPIPSPRLSPRASVSRSPFSAPTPAAEGPISGGILPPTPSSDSPIPSPSADQAPTPASSETPSTSPSAEQVPPPPTFTGVPAASPASSGSPAISSRLAAAVSSAAVVAAGLAFLM